MSKYKYLDKKIAHLTLLNNLLKVIVVILAVGLTGTVINITSLQNEIKRQAVYDYTYMIEPTDSILIIKRIDLGNVDTLNIATFDAIDDALFEIHMKDSIEAEDGIVKPHEIIHRGQNMQVTAP